MMTWDDYFFLSFQRTCLWLNPRVGDEIIRVDEFLVYNSDLPIFQDAFQTGEPTANFASQILWWLTTQILECWAHIKGRGLFVSTTSHQPPLRLSGTGERRRDHRGIRADRWGVSRQAKCWSLHTAWNGKCCSRLRLRDGVLRPAKQLMSWTYIWKKNTWSGFGRCFFTMASVGFRFFLGEFVANLQTTGGKIPWNAPSAARFCCTGQFRRARVTPNYFCCRSTADRRALWRCSFPQLHELWKVQLLMLVVDMGTVCPKKREIRQIPSNPKLW